MSTPNPYPTRYKKLAEQYESDAHWARTPQDRKEAEKQLKILKELAAAEKALEDKGFVSYEYGVAFEMHVKSFPQPPVMSMSEEEIAYFRTLPNDTHARMRVMRRRAAVEPGLWETDPE